MRQGAYILRCFKAIKYSVSIHALKYIILILDTLFVCYYVYTCVLLELYLNKYIYTVAILSLYLNYTWTPPPGRKAGRHDFRG